MTVCLMSFPLRRFPYYVSSSNGRFAYYVSSPDDKDAECWHFPLTDPPPGLERVKHALVRLG